MAEHPTLQTATAPPHILEAAARFEWYSLHQDNCPASMIPTEQALAAWLPECPEAVQEESARLAGGLLPPGPSGPLVFTAGGLLPPGPSGPLVFTAGGPSLKEWVRQDPEGASRSLQSLALTVAVSTWQLWMGRPAEVLAEPDAPGTFGDAVQVLHEAWRNLPDKDRPKHPLGPVVRAWMKRPQPVAVDRRSKGIVPAPFVKRTRQDVLFSLDAPSPEQPGLVQVGPVQAALIPELDPENRPEQPALLRAYDALGGHSGRQRGIAPVEMRTWIEALLSVPVAARDGRLYRIQSPVTGQPFTIGEIVFDWLQWKSYKPRHRLQGQALAKALGHLHGLTVPMGKHGGFYRPLMVEAVQGWGLHHRVAFLARLPAGSKVGPSVDRNVLRALGKQSEPAYRAYLALCFDWDRYGAHNGKLILPSRPIAERDSQGHILNPQGQVITGRGGVPVKSPYDKRAILTGEREPNPARTRYPEYWPDDLLHLCFPNKAIAKAGTALRRDQQRRTRKAIDLIRKAGGCTLEGRRIMPPDIEA